MQEEEKEYTVLILAKLIVLFKPEVNFVGIFQASHLTFAFGFHSSHCSKDFEYFAPFAAKTLQLVSLKVGATLSSKLETNASKEWGKQMSGRR